MSTREQFGGYLLLKKLGEDPLGETYRAGKIGKQGLDRVVLMRVFNGPGIDGPRLWQRVSERAGVHQILKSPNLGDGVDMGEVRGTPYVAYDYISGRNLAVLFEQAEKRRSPFPLDHAMLIAERLAQGVAVAYESRLNDERILHGFLVPHLIMLSNEGETRLLGFEMAPGLREVATGGGAREQFARYLAPEALAGGAPNKADDVYSLGAMLFELLTGKRLPPPAATGYGTLIDQAQLPIEASPIPAEIGMLLKRSLAPRDQRLGDATQWHKAIAKTMADGHYNPTTFNLAFFMHNLLRDEIEREAQEMAAEKKIAVPAPAAVPVAAPAATATAPPAPRFGVRDETSGGTMADTGAEGSNKGMLIGIAAAVLIAVGGGVFWAMSRSATPAAPTTEPAAAAAETVVAVPTGPTVEDLQKQIEALANNQQDLKLRDEQIKLLQKQVEDARRNAAERPAAPAPRPAPALQPIPPSTSAPAPVTTTPPPITAAPASTTTSPATSAPPPTASPAAAAPTATTTTPPVTAPVTTQPVAAAPAPTAAATTTRYGDLVTMGPGVTPPKKIRVPAPSYPEIARRTNRTATVVVSVLIDENGRVLESRVKTKVGLGFDESALRAARGATYTPASKDGVKVKMWAELAVTFQP